MMVTGFAVMLAVSFGLGAGQDIKNSRLRQINREFTTFRKTRHPECWEKNNFQWCGQRQNHFSESDGSTWCQAYSVNSSFYKPGGPVFLCIGGEGPMMNLSSEDAPLIGDCDNMIELAPKHNAMLFAVYHRFYEHQFPVQDYSTSTLKSGLFTSEQALADLASFHGYATKKYNLKSSKWITFGGSYPGALSSWARLLYPDQFYGAIASSAPVHAVADFTGYMDVVASALMDPRVGGSYSCLETLTEGHRQIGEMLKTDDGRRELEQKFNLCGEKPLDDAKTSAMWAGMGVVKINVQYNGQMGAIDPENGYRIDAACQTLSDLNSNLSAGESIVDVLAKMDDILAAEGNNTNCTEVSYDTQIEELQNDSLDVLDNNRLWQFQTCNEFGWYQTCELGTNCPWTQGLGTYSAFMEMCVQLFNFTEDEVLDNINRTNKRYGSVNPLSTRVYFVNGLVDPWHWESVLVAPLAEINTMLVPGMSHCQWMAPAGSATVDSLNEYLDKTKGSIQTQVSLWLGTGTLSTPTAASSKSFLSRRAPQKEEQDDTAHLQIQETLNGTGPTLGNVLEL